MAPARKHPHNATFAELARLPEDTRAEIVHGEIVQRALPTMQHSRGQTGLAAFLRRYFDRRPGGRWPGGWWIGTEVEVEYERHELFCHDLAGWRRDRVPECPSGRPARIRPDWTCEILSTNRRRDMVDKFRVMQACSVPHYWIVDPEEKTLTVFRLEPHGYLVALAAATGETVRAEPFDALELRIAVLLGDEDEDE